MDNLKELVAKAEKAVEGLEEPLKSIGFKTILAKLLEKKEDIEKPKKILKKSGNGKDDEIRDIHSKINRTEFPKMYKLKKALDQALYILKIVRDVTGNEGLLPLRISKMLGSVFRIKTTPAAINMALGNAGTYVDRKPVRVQGGQGYEYLLMHEGEEYLDKKLGELKENGT